MENVTDFSSRLQSLSAAQRSKFRTYKCRLIKKGLSPEAAEIEALEAVLNPKRTREAKSKASASLDAPTVVASTGSDGDAVVINFPARALPAETVTTNSVTQQSIDTAAPTVVAPIIIETPEQPQQAAPSPDTPATFTVASATFTQPVTWSVSSATSVNSNSMSRERATAQLAVSGLGLLVAVPALVYLQANAGGLTPESLFWALLTELGGLILMCYPAKRLRNKVIMFLLGLSLVATGFGVMSIAVSRETKASSNHAVAQNDGVITLQGQIARKNDRLNSLRISLNALPPTYISQRRAIEAEFDAAEKELTRLENELLQAKNALYAAKPAALAQKWGAVENTRRLALVIIAFVCGSGFSAAFPVVWRNMRHKKLAQLV